MRDLRNLPDRLVDDLAAVRWPDPAEIRRRGCRRTYRTAVGAPLAVLLVLAAVWAVPRLSADRLAGPVAGRPSADAGRPSADASSPAPNAGTLPTPLPTFVLPGNPSWIPPEALLRPADVGPGFRLSDEDTFEPGEEVFWAFDLDGRCPGYSAPDMSGYQRFLHMRVHTVEKDAESNGEQAVRQQVVRYPGDTAKRVIAEAFLVVEKCSRYTGPSEASLPDRPAMAEHDWTVLDRDFAGDESMLVRHDVRAVETATGQTLNSTRELYAVIRVRDLVAVLQTDHYDERRMAELAARAASWLCTATTGRC